MLCFETGGIYHVTKQLVMSVVGGGSLNVVFGCGLVWLLLVVDLSLVNSF